MAVQIQLRRGNYSEWNSANPTLAVGEIGVELDTKKFKIGDGSLAWNSLSYGAQGLQGNQGNQGYQGFQGYNGNQGFQGFIGNQGYQGFQGYQGTQGNQGYQGFQGYQGYQGYTGNQGFQGYQGYQGQASTVQGPQGFQGFQGANGTQGFQGSTGSQGNQGYQGFQGATGAGTQGNQGYQGYTGTTGPQGFPGVFGGQGTQQDITSSTLVDIGGLVVTLPSSGTYVFESTINAMCQTGTQGAQFGAQFSGTTTSIEFNYQGNLAITSITTCRVTAKNTAGITLLTTSAAEGKIYLSGIIIVSTSGNFSIQGLRILGGGAQHLYIRPGSYVSVMKIA